MKNRIDGTRVVIRTRVIVLAICAVGLPEYSHGQPETPVQEADPPGILTEVMQTLQVFLAPGTLAHANALYAYDPAELRGLWVYPDRVGDVATVSSCSRNVENARIAGNDRITWCARYFHGPDAVRRAYDAAVADGANDDVYFATTHALPDLVPERQFVARPSP